MTDQPAKDQPSESPAEQISPEERAARQAELRKQLGAFTGFRPVGEKKWYSPEADILVQAPRMIQMVVIAFRQERWPELTRTLQSPHSEEEVVEAILKANDTISGYLESVAKPPYHNNFFEALEAVGWNDVPHAGRVGFCSMIGLYMLSRLFVASRHINSVGPTINESYERIAEAASELMRMYDQEISMEAEARRELREAVAKAARAGLSSGMITRLVEQAAADVC